MAIQDSFLKHFRHDHEEQPLEDKEKQSCVDITSNDSLNISDVDVEEPVNLIYTEDRLNNKYFKWFWRTSAFIDRLGEARGVQRQPPNKRCNGTIWDYIKLSGIWFGGTCSVPSMTGFFLGPLLFNLSFGASVGSGVAGVFVGSLVAAFGATMGPRSGLRQIMGSKFQFGWYFSMFIGLVNNLSGIGWGIVNSNFAGQLLSAMTNEKISVQIGMLINFLVVLFLSVFGLRILELFDFFFMIPIFVSFLLCYICAGNTFDVTSPSLVTGVNFNANWISFFSSSVGITSSWMPIASDYFVDMPEDSNPWVIFFFTLFVIFVPTVFTGILGVGLASTGLYNEEYAEIYNNLGGAGLIVNSMKKWHGGGIFLSVLMFISLITNSGLTMYSFGLCFQTYFSFFARFPRYIFAIIGSCLCYILSAVGQSGWSEIISNFLPMIGYWCMIYAAILLTETFLFRRHKKDDYQWKYYLTKDHFPIMYASLFGFACGVAGVAVGMYQYYYLAPIAALVGDGADLGTFLAFGFAMVAYIPARYLEIRLRKDPVVKP